MVESKEFLRSVLAKEESSGFMVKYLFSIFAFKKEDSLELMVKPLFRVLAWQRKKV